MTGVVLFILGICIGILVISILHKKNEELADKQALERKNYYDSIIRDLNKEIISYKDIIKSLNKDIEKLNKSNDNFK